MADATPQIEEVKSNWRTEITHHGRYWHFRRGSGKSRLYMRGGRVDKLPPERIEAYNKHVTRKVKKRIARSTSDSGNIEKYNFTLAGVERQVLDSESRPNP